MIAAEFLKAARTYAERGFAVFPLVPHTKRPIVSGGFKVATRDPAKIDEWWKLTPNANVGIATGTVSGLIVLDMDPRNGGEESHRELSRRFGRWSDTPIAHTGGGGTHEFFQHPADEPVPCRSNLGEFVGIDLKGDGGYVVAPPSIHPNGESYLWDLLFGIDAIDVSEAPKFLVVLARQGISTNPQAYKAEPWDGTVPDAVSYAVAVSGKVARRYFRGPHGLVDGSASGIDFSLACLLAMFGCDGATIEAGLRASREEADLPSRRDSYFKSTIGKALTFATERQHNE
jgi:hypothetical protein